MQHVTNLIDLSTERRIHIVGIGGSGMSAIAQVLLAMGHEVTGSDAVSSSVMERVITAGAVASIGHGAENLPLNVEAVAISTAIAADNPEIVEARRRNLPILRRADLLASVARVRRTIAVAGTHGKTTTSTFLALVLEAGGVRPSWVIGGEILGRGNGAHWDTGPWFVVEADESDGTFMELGAEAVVVTNIEPDHLEHYGSWEKLQSAFNEFVKSASGPKVLCADDPIANEIAKNCPNSLTYGKGERADFRIIDIELGRFTSEFSIKTKDECVRVNLPAPGLHNIQNATAALVMGHCLGVPIGVGVAGLENYAGVGRRFQLRGEVSGITFIDDYAHLPSEVKAATAAAKGGNWNRIIAVFQPHRYSRTQQVGKDFAESFNGVDQLILADIYAAGEKPRPGINGRLVLDAINSSAGHPPVVYVEERSMLASVVADSLKPGDLCLTLGAGDITKLADEVIARFAEGVRV